MPLHQADVRRRHRDAARPQAEPSNRGVAPDPPDQAGEAHHAAEERRPDDDFQPDRCALAERREVDPVGDRSQVSPEALAPGRAEHHVAGERRHVQPRVVRIVEGEAMHRHLPAGLQRPLIGLGEVAVVVERAVVSRGVAADECFGLGSTHVGEHVARVGEDDLLVARGAQAVHGPIAAHPDSDAIDTDSRRAGCRVPVRGSRQPGASPAIGGEAGRARSLDRRQRHAGEIERGGPREALLVRQSRHAGVHHHHARQEPGNEEDAPGYSEPPVEVDRPPAPVEPTLHWSYGPQSAPRRTRLLPGGGRPRERGSGRGASQNPTRSATSAERGIPRNHCGSTFE